MRLIFTVVRLGRRFTVRSDTKERFDENDAAADPPAVAAVDELIRTALKSAELDREPLHLRAPPQERTGVYLRLLWQ